jgi:hypothetical protein
MHGIGNLPRPIEAHVRNEFLSRPEERTWRASRRATSSRSVPSRRACPAFQIVLDNGAMWSRVPLHMLVTKATAGKPLPARGAVPLGLLRLRLRGDRVHTAARRHRAPPLRSRAITGRYIATIEWLGGRFAEIPDQHKNHHLIALDSGEIAAWPNNRVQWLDPSFITPVEGNPGTWRTATRGAAGNEARPQNRLLRNRRSERTIKHLAPPSPREKNS